MRRMNVNSECVCCAKCEQIPSVIPIPPPRMIILKILMTILLAVLPWIAPVIKPHQIVFFGLCAAYILANILFMRALNKWDLDKKNSSYASMIIFLQSCLPILLYLEAVFLAMLFLSLTKVMNVSVFDLLSYVPLLVLGIPLLILYYAFHVLFRMRSTS